MKTEIQTAEENILQLEQSLKQARRHHQEVLNSMEFPRSASKYWYLINHGNKWEVCSGMFGGGSKLCQKRRAAGNAYPTEDEAQQVCDIRNTLTDKIGGWV